MSDETNSDTSGLPPKISVRKVMSVPAAPVPATSAPGSAPQPQAVAPAAPTPVQPGAAAPRPVERPNTIKARPIARPLAKPASSPAPAAKVESVAARAQETASPAAPVRPIAATIKPRTVVANPVVKTPAKEGGADPAVRIAAKRETTKVPLEAARPKEEGESEPTTGTPVAKPKTVVVDKPQAPEPPPEEAAKQATAAAAKRTTSRISLEAVLGAEEDDAGTGPKTIRLKRPGAAASAKVNTVTTVRKKPVPQSATATKVDAAVTDDESTKSAADSDTQRKTVVVKKSGGAKTARKTVSVSRPGGEGATADSPAGQAPKTKKELGEPSWVFAVYSLAAVLVTCVLIYVITAQVVGPNASLTEYSYAKTGPELPWPGKISGPRSY